MFRSVDLPLPEGPSRTVNPPTSRSTLTPRSACTWTSPIWYTLVTSRMETASEPFGTAAVPLLLPFNSALCSFGYLYGAQPTLFRRFGTGEGTPASFPGRPGGAQGRERRCSHRHRPAQRGETAYFPVP